VQGASQAQEVRTGRQVRKNRARSGGASRSFKNGLEGTGRMEARKGTIRERETRQVEVRRKLTFNDNGDAEAGPKGGFQSSARRKRNAGRSRREGGSRRAQAR
jgi:hypothetical protein